jgi:RIO-like serine/threonine protein kinase
MLKIYFWHGVDLDGELKVITQFIKLGEFQMLDWSYYLKARADTTEALLEYERHLLQYLEEHFRKKMEIQKMKESAKDKGQLKSVVQTIKIKYFDDIKLFASGSCVKLKLSR